MGRRRRNPLEKGGTETGGLVSSNSFAVHRYYVNRFLDKCFFFVSGVGFMGVCTSGRLAGYSVGGWFEVCDIDVCLSVWRRYVKIVLRFLKDLDLLNDLSDFQFDGCSAVTDHIC